MHSGSNAFYGKDNQLFILQYCMLPNALCHMAKSQHIVTNDIEFISSMWTAFMVNYLLHIYLASGPTWQSGLVVIWHWKDGGTEIFVSGGLVL